MRQEPEMDQLHYDSCLIKPQVVIPGPVWQKIMAYVTACPTEINGFGYVEIGPDGTITVTDVFILEQVASAGDVEVDFDKMSLFLTEMMRRGDDPGRIRFQWHSHVRMPAWFSLTDRENIERWPGEWLISLVVNQMSEYSCRLDLKQGLRLAVDIRPTIQTEIPASLLASVRQEIRQLVRRRIPLARPRPPLLGGRPARKHTERTLQAHEVAVAPPGDTPSTRNVLKEP